MAQASYYNFKRIQVVPTATDFLDIVLSSTQRKTPTVIHPNYKISRIRQFYLKKVKYAHDTFEEKLSMILNGFPKLTEIHPFYADLMNVLYDRDHYKLALGQLNTARHLIDQVSKDYAKLIKYGDSLYRCKQLKRAALGRMATIMKRQKDALAYLEQVRQHLARLPSIDPNTRTLIVCGYPNVGKSSFMNKVTRANVEVQPYAFTTKSLFVGHMDYKYLRWQVIDTPGILDHPLEQRNTIEMQSVTALAHLRAAILFFMDLSEQCGYSITDQVHLFHSIKPLFASKPVFLVINKIDVKKPEDLTPAEQALLRDIVEKDGATMLQLSCFTEEGVMDVRNVCCDRLLMDRVQSKLRGNKVKDVLNQLHLATPQSRDDKERPAFIPEAAKGRRKYDKLDPNRPKLERDLELEEGGAGVYNVDLKKRYQLKDPNWKYDFIPEIMDGKNVADFVDPDIEAKLAALEEEEERLVQQGFYDSPDEVEDEDEEIELGSDDEPKFKMSAKQARTLVKEKKQQAQLAHILKKSARNRPVVPKKLALRQGDARGRIKEQLESVGLSATKVLPNLRGRSRGRSLVDKKRSASAMDMDDDPMQVDTKRTKRVASVSQQRSRSRLGVKNEAQLTKATKIARQAQTPRNLDARKGESDRHVWIKKPKHLFSGKRGIGKTDRH